MRKYDYISMLAEETAQEVSKNGERWKKYLHTASRLYKYSFEDQLLIYAQRSDASACATVEIWNQAMNCWVNRGAKGIALIDDNSPYGGLRYVFDISDVHKSRRTGRFPNLWQMQKKHKEAVLHRLELLYGETESSGSFVERMKELSGKIAEEHYRELAGKVELHKEDSLLKDMDVTEIEAKVKETLAASIAYTVLIRCGMDREEVEESIEFPYIHEFNSMKTISLLGSHVSDLSKQVLVEIGRTIGAYGKEQEVQIGSYSHQKSGVGEQSESHEKNLKLGLANNPKTHYNALKRKSENGEKIDKVQTGRDGEGGHYETEIRKERGLSDSDAEKRRTAGGNTDEIRNDEKDISEGEREGALFSNAAGEQPYEASAGSTGAGRGTDGGSDKADDEAGGRDGAAQGREPVVVGAEDEQYQGDSGGEHLSGTDLQLNMDKEERSGVMSGLSLSELEKDILRFDEFMTNKCTEIAGYFLFEEDVKKQTDYVKRSYKQGEFTEFYVGSERVGYCAEEDGLLMWRGNYLNRSEEVKLSWHEIRNKISAYIAAEEYLKGGQVPQWKEAEPVVETYEQLSLFPSFEEQVGIVCAAQAEKKEMIPQGFQVTDAQLEAILRSGGGRTDSRKRIYAKYLCGRTPEEMADFLQKEYGTTGKGFDFNGTSLSVWFDVSGMRIGHGMSASEHTVKLLNWQEIEAYIRQMIEAGSYMGMDEAFLVDAVERKRIANDIWIFFRDGMEHLPETLTVQKGGYPADLEHIMSLLETEEGRELVAQEVADADILLLTGEKELRVKYVKSPDDLLSEIEDLELPKQEFPQPDFVEIKNEDFITQDEIDYRLTRGSGFEHGNFRIYDYFMQHHTKEENVAFLKAEYGTGGSSHALVGNDSSQENHDAKGISLEKGNYGSPFAKVLLNWNVVEKRIRQLVDADKYLSPKGKEAYAAYKQEEAEKAMQREQEKLEHGIRLECKNAIEKAIADNFDGYTLASNAAQIVINQYGTERVEFILANTLIRKQWDGRISEDNKKWAAEITPYADWNTRELTVESHPAVLNGFVNQARRYFALEQEKKAEQTFANIILNDTENEPKHVEKGEENESVCGYNFVSGKEEPTLVTEVNKKEENTSAVTGTQRKFTERLGRYVSGYAVTVPAENQDENIHKDEVTEAEQNDELKNHAEENRIKSEPESSLLEDTKAQALIQIDAQVSQKAQQLSRSSAANFHITPDMTEQTGRGFAAKEKFRQNIEAIRILKLIESEQRNATPQEQEILAKYVGWGGLSEAFDSNKTDWRNEYQELKELLSFEEYILARESTLNAHYTSLVIIQAMYEALEKMGFEKGNVLEPSMGIGNFFGMLPEKMSGSRLYGVELDGITGRIAKQLYPKADIKITGFEKTDYPNDFFDVAVGNIPFGQYKVPDREYDRYNFQVHDYFLAKTLDKVRPGGVIAFITSKGTLDKKNPSFRRYLAERAELLGAVRLPNTAFKENAGTEVTSDILFLKKRDRVRHIEPDWVYLKENEDGIVVNSYFAEHPKMVLGKMEMVSGPYGMESTCKPNLSVPFAKQLSDAVAKIEGSIDEIELEEAMERQASLPADPMVKNYSYTIVDGEVYYRENSIMQPVNVPDKTKQRIKGMVAIRDCTRELLEYQLAEYPEDMIKNKQTELNELYDAFVQKFEMLNARANKLAFSQDSSYCLLCSLEKLDDEGNFKGKADMFTKRTIKRAEAVTSVDTASEALAVSLSEKAKIDLSYMSGLCGKGEEDIIKELAGVIFKNPMTNQWETADQYLSGNVRSKLRTAEHYAQKNPEFAINVSALKNVQPKDLDASEIEVRIGATWLKPKYIEDFMKETFGMPAYLFARGKVSVQYSKTLGQWKVNGKNEDKGNTLVSMTYGTGRANACKILEDSLNLKDTRIFDTIEEDGVEKRVLNKKETMLASQKQEAIREAFKEWIFKDAERRQEVCKNYNELFNSRRPREFDGSHLKFPGMTPDIQLKPHQLNAVARQLYGTNTLLAHVVGAGKTFEMIAAAMESKRLGLCRKSLFVVPNHLTEQWAGDFLRLYPGANILAATKRDFESANRKKFCSRIATGEFDAVIIGHSQFERIPLSAERQAAMIENQVSEIEAAIEAAKAEKEERYTIKQMERTRKNLTAKLERLYNEAKKDDVITFEQLGVDRLFVDESHAFKNLFLYTKMRNVAGIAQTEAQKSTDMFAKCRYMDELTGCTGITFATGTPISNSMTELYTNMRYLQYETLRNIGLGSFDEWASTFGETQTAIELAPEGTGYRAKTRFSKFYNLPELISLFKECADIQTADMLNLPVPKVEYENVVLKPSEYQKQMVESLADRAERVRNREVDTTIDNMLKITNDGRKLALDQRLINEMLPDEENSKAAVCAEKAFEIWEQTKAEKSTQIIFCDLSTPKGDGTFNVYDDIKNKLMAKGVPEEEIAFIHQANTDAKKAELFAKVRSGQVRFLMGSTAKMGAGCNVQDKLIALHHADVPWRPADINQQEGRILRQGNQNEKVKIFRYVTEQTFDSYNWVRREVA